MKVQNRAWLASAGLHFTAISIIAAAVWMSSDAVVDRSTKTKVEFTVKEVTAPVLNVPPPSKVEESKPPPDPSPIRKEVFGVSRNAITTNSELPESEAVTAKIGNTLAKESDDLKLDKDDEESLPIPTEEYLVSRLPSLQSEVKVAYPEQAKRKGIEGPVVLDILIDNTGRVRDVTLVSGPGNGLNEAAMDAIKQFKFSAAEANGEKVAVRIRYTYRFVLER